MALQEAFLLTPKKSYSVTGQGHSAFLNAYGITNKPYYRESFDYQHAADELYFWRYSAADAAADYRVWSERRRVPRVELHYDLSAFEPHKEVALTFRFDAMSESRVLVYTDAELLDEEILHVGDDQFLIEVESTSYLSLYFIHATLDGSPYGGYWFFRGIDGYIA